MMVGPSIKTLVRSLIEEQPPEHNLKFDFQGVRVRVSSNSDPLLGSLSRYFHGFEAPAKAPADLEVVALHRPDFVLEGDFIVKQPDPGKSKIKEEFLDLPDGRVVKKRLTGMFFLFGNGFNVGVGPCLENDNQVINFINNRLIEWDLDRGALLAHAAGVSVQDRGLALAGFSGMGKSTLALHLMNLGMTFISNDRLLIKEADGTKIMRGVPKLPRINPGTALNNPSLSGVIPEEDRRRFEAMDSDSIWDLEHKYDVDIEECFGPGLFHLESPLSALAILNWQRRPEPIQIQRVDLRERRDLLGAVIKSPGLFYQPEVRSPDYSEEDYLKRFEGLAVFEITGGVDFLAAADACLEHLQSL